MAGALYSVVRLLCNTVYPAYKSFKAVKSKSVRDYVRWMMYWIVFATFTTLETLLDPFMIFWFPFYSEIKILLLLYLVSPITKGSGIIYRRFLHPLLSARETEIDQVIDRTSKQGYERVAHYATRGASIVATSLLDTALKGGGSLVNQIRRSYNMSDISDLAELAFRDESRFTDVTDQYNSERPGSSKLKRRQMRKDDFNQSLRKEDLRGRFHMEMSADMVGSTESLSSGYCSDSFMPVPSDTMDTQDYELWDRRQQIRYSPKNPRKHHGKGIQSDGDDEYEDVTTPFGRLKSRSGPMGGAVSPDPASSYYPSDQDSEEDDHYKHYHVNDLRPRSRNPVGPPRVKYPVDPYQMRRDLPQLSPDLRGRESSGRHLGSADVTIEGHNANGRGSHVGSADMTTEDHRGRGSHVGSADMTMEDLQQAARRLNLQLVCEESPGNGKPAPPKRSGKPGFVPQGTDPPAGPPPGFTVFPNKSFEFQPNISAPILPITLPEDNKTTIQVSQSSTKTNLDLFMKEKENNLVPSEATNTYIQQASHSVTELAIDMCSKQIDEHPPEEIIQGQDPISHFSLMSNQDKTPDTSDSEFFEPDETFDTIENPNDKFDESNMNLVIANEEEVEFSEANSSFADANAYITTQDPNLLQTFQFNFAGETSLENVLDEEGSMDETKCSPDFAKEGIDLEEYRIEPSSIILNSPRLVQDVQTLNVPQQGEFEGTKTALGAQGNDAATQGDGEVFRPSTKIKSAKKTRAPQPPLDETNPFLVKSESVHSMQSLLSQSDSSMGSEQTKPSSKDFLARLNRNDGGGEGAVLYRSPGYPGITESPLTPDIRLQRSLSPLLGYQQFPSDQLMIQEKQVPFPNPTNPSSDQLIQEKPVPFPNPTNPSCDQLIQEKPVAFSNPTKIITTSRTGITRLRRYTNEADSDEPQRVPGAPEDEGSLSRCPHCDIHSWLPHSPSCPKLKKK